MCDNRVKVDLQNNNLDVYPVTNIKISDIDISKYTVCCKDFSPVFEYAIEELQKYIRFACGVDLQKSKENNRCTIFLEVDKSVTEVCDGYKISVSGSRLKLSGYSERGVLYAVYTFLEKFIGFRWYAKNAEYIFSTETINVPDGTELEEKPVFEYRSAYYYSHLNSADLCVKHKVNSANLRTMKPQFGGGIGYNGFVHTLGSMVPESKYINEHPEYYALYNGERNSGQLCLSNPDVLNIVIEETLRRLRENPQRIISVSQNDNIRFCSCPECAKIDEEEGSHMGTLLRFVNAVADAVAKEFPEVMVDTLAYQYTRRPPKITVPRENVIIRLCSIECCFNHPLDDPKCTENANFKRDIEDWNEICHNLYVWDYATNFAHYFSPFPNYNAMHKNMKFYAEHHVKGLLEQSNYDGEGADFTELHSYLASKLLWNPYMSEEEYSNITIDFLKGFYGNAWEYIYNYLSILKESVAGKHFAILDNPTKYLDVFASRLDEINALWDLAEDVAENEEILLRIRKARMSVMYIDILLRYNSRIEASEESKKLLFEENKLFFDRFFEYDLRLCEWYTLIKEQPDLTKRIDEWIHDKERG